MVRLENFESGCSLLMEKVGGDPPLFGGSRGAHPEYLKRKRLLESGASAPKLKADFYDGASAISAVTL